jgi:predicted NAD/FAD-binding protein
MTHTPCKRTWNTPHRERWNAPIHHLLKAIDNHTDLYLKTGDKWHTEKAAQLRAYVAELKTYLHTLEGRD